MPCRARRVDPDPVGSGSKIFYFTGSGSGPGPEIFILSGLGPKLFDRMNSN